MVQEKTTIDKIIENFDFETVIAFCTLTGKKYLGEKITIEKLKETAQYVLIRAEMSNEDNSDCITGMFHASKRKYPNSGTYLKLEFVLKSWEEKLF